MSGDTEHYALPPEGKRPLGRSRGRWEDIKFDVKSDRKGVYEVGWFGLS